MLTKAHGIIGVSNNSGGRVFADHYPTPLPAIEKLLEVENFSGSIWEPACGEGNISNVLIKMGYNVYSSDKYDYGFGRIHDFLDPPKPVNYPIVDNIVTNPPFNRALDFVKMSKIYSKKKIAFLHKIQFLEGVERYQMWQDKEFPLKAVYQFTRRVTFPSQNSTAGGMIAFAWFIWERGCINKPYIDWID